MGELFYEIKGEGEPLVFLNGVMMTTASWALQTRELSKRYRCILHDFRGQLRSDKPRGPYSMDRHVRDLRDLLDELGVEQANIAGTSYGGEVGMMFAARYPERVSRLLVIASVSHVGEEVRRKVALWRDVARDAPEMLYDVSVPDNFSPQFLEEHPEIIMAGRERLRSYAPEFFFAFADLCDAFLELDIREELQRIVCPTLVISGAEDTLKPLRYSEEIAALIPHAELVVIPGAGHAVVIEKAAEINREIVRFVSFRA